MRLIDADALIKYCDDNWIPLNVDAVNAQPTIEERKTGKWNWIGFNIECSECGCMPCFDSTEPLYNYCPNCGADMRGGKHETP